MYIVVVICYLYVLCCGYCMLWLFAMWAFVLCGYYSGAGVGLEVINSVVWWVVCALLM